MMGVISGACALGLLWGIMTLGVYLTYKVLDIADLSVEGTLVTGAAITAAAMKAGVSPPLAILLSALGGILAGLVTGFLHTRLRIPALLSGILCMIALYSVNIRIMGNAANISLLRMDTVFTPVEGMISNKNLAGVIIGLLVCGVAVSLLHLFLRTELGCALRATGNNPAMAKAQGINTQRCIILGLAISNCLAGVSGNLIAQFLGFSDVQMGGGAIVIGLASLIIGEVLFAGRRGMLRMLISVTCGAVLYRIIIAMVLEAGMPASDLKLFTAITVAVALYLGAIEKNQNRRKRIFGRLRTAIHPRGGLTPVTVKKEHKETEYVKRDKPAKDLQFRHGK